MSCRHRSRFFLPVLSALLLFIAPVAAHAKSDVETAGDILRFALPAAAGGYSLMQGDEEGAVQLVKSLAVSSALVFGIKHAIKSDRPDGSGDDSFPSGHAANAFTAASYVDHRYGWKLGLPAYMAAGFVAYSRVDADKHHTLDVVASAVLSWTVSHIFVEPLPVEAGAVVGRDRALLRVSARW